MDDWSLLEGSIQTITAVSTLVMAVATYTIARVSARTLKAGTTPQVVAYLEKHFHDHIVPLITIVLENVGQGVAQNVVYQLHFEDDAGQQQAKKLFLANKKALKMDFLSPGARREMTLGSTSDLYDQGAESSVVGPFCVTVQYENLAGKRYKEQTFTLDPSDFEGTGGEGTSPFVDIQSSLRKIEKHLGQWGSSPRR